MSVKIRTKNDKLILDIHYGEGRRTRPTTGLKDTADNRKLLETDVIPNIKKEIALGTYVPRLKELLQCKQLRIMVHLVLRDMLTIEENMCKQVTRNILRSTLYQSLVRD